MLQFISKRPFCVQLKDINTMLSRLSSSIKEFKYVNRNIDKAIKSREYQEILERLPQSHSQLDNYGLQCGLDSFSHIFDHLGQDSNLEPVRQFLAKKADNLLQYPINVLCDTYYNLTLLRSDTNKFQDQILTHIKINQSIPGEQFVRLLRALTKKFNLTEYDHQLILVLNQLNIKQSQVQILLKCFRYFAELHTLHQKPLYAFPELFEYIATQIKKFPTHSYGDIFCAYHHLGTAFDQSFLHKTVQEFEHSIATYKNGMTQLAMQQYITILRIANKLDKSDIVKFNWDLHFNALKELLSSRDFNQKTNITSFCSLFIDKISQYDQSEKDKLFEMIRSFQTPGIWDFFYQNKQYFTQQQNQLILEEFINYGQEQQQVSDQKYPQNYVFYNKYARLYNLPERKEQQFLLGGLVLSQYEQTTDEVQTMKFLQNVTIKNQFWSSQFKILLSSINGTQTLEFWKQQTIKNTRRVQEEYSFEIQRHLNGDFNMFPKVFNQYQCQFVIWSFQHFQMAPVLVAPIFYRTLGTHQKYVFLKVQPDRRIGELIYLSQLWFQ
ncbi:unnamed protein product (macronuclear) [Paramecium tetraurelia]|uniref:RAP domain-containing protein n=1 Tax=Paramecium tetraurelia TaxID=5888 RepID=A0BLI6_PARTE|nr:uncharacterized protein GSPATT00030036001 [Paramecium tetraurelia]CAK59403.1 unnamed protein product [Paramecium tetraurelia]|eukprot:XP_001426801.1 hypothetical protein (macronuclear) [Paramecium tetraurelia strain d4-2]